MQVRAFQDTWHGIDLDKLVHKHDSRPAGPELYARVYEALDHGIGRADQQWIWNKQQTGRFISSEVFRRWEDQTGRSPRILALCVGMCIAEREWLEQGWNVTLHECQTASLKEIRSQFPTAPVIIGDIRDVAIPPCFDIIALLASDYFLSRCELQHFIQKAIKALATDGLLVIQSVSILSIWQALKEAVKAACGRYRRAFYISWGYWRTPSEFARSTRRYGFTVRASYSMTFSKGRLIAKWRGTRRATWPPLLHNAALMVFQRTA